MWTRDDILKAATAARDMARRDQCLSEPRLRGVMVDVAVRMALDNAATIAERRGDPETQNAIDALKDQFS